MYVVQVTNIFLSLTIMFVPVSYGLLFCCRHGNPFSVNLSIFVNTVSRKYLMVIVPDLGSPLQADPAAITMREDVQPTHHEIEVGAVGHFMTFHHYFTPLNFILKVLRERHNDEPTQTIRTSEGTMLQTF